jgi:hypothetical protein
MVTQRRWTLRKSQFSRVPLMGYDFSLDVPISHRPTSRVNLDSLLTHEHVEELLSCTRVLWLLFARALQGGGDSIFSGGKCI